MYRIFHDVLDLDCKTSGILLLFFFSFAYIMITIIVPDHFCISLFLIIYTLYFAGKKIKESKTFSLLEMSILFVITAGVTLSNGIIVLLSVLFTNGKSLFKYKYITTIFLLSVAMLGLGLIENQFIGGANPQTVKSWVDVTTPRVDTIVENMFGESIQLHRKYLLGDVLVRRPVIVRYSYYVQYVVEALIFLLFIAGICVGRRSRYMWLYVSCFMYAVLLHVVIGFGVNEVYIMSAHWIYVIPVAIAFLIHGLKRGTRFAVNTLIIILSSYLLSYNGYLLYHYLTWPLSFD